MVDSLLVSAGYHDYYNPNLNLDEVKRSLLEYVEAMPGIRYKELARMTGMAHGVLSYHLAFLEKSGHIKVERKIGSTRYYPLGTSEEDSRLIGILRSEQLRKVVLFILEKGVCTFSDIVQHTGRSQSTVSNYLMLLKKEGIVAVGRDARHQLFRIKNSEIISNVFSKYRQSFVDKIVDNYTEMINEL